MNKQGLFYAFMAYLLWGLLPIYWKQLAHVPPVEIFSHRMVWSMLLIVVLLTVARRWQWIGPTLRNPRLLGTFVIVGLLVATNWLVYIWAVNNNFILETSLGYFINPLVSVALGVIFLGERMRFSQWIAIGIAAVGVLYLTISYGAPPLIALTLALTFGAYGLIKKTTSLNALEGLSLETSILFVPTVGYLLYLGAIGRNSFGPHDLHTSLLLACAGAATALPLLFFAAGARRIPLYMVGVLQYIAPTLQFILGAFVYNEPFTTQRLIGFAFIWCALLLYTLEGLVWRRRIAAPHVARPAATQQ